MFEHFDTVLSWEIQLYPSAAKSRGTNTLRNWYAAAPELWFWEEDRGQLLGLLAIVPVTMDKILQLASCEFAELDQEPFAHWREREHFPQTVLHIYEFYVRDQNHALAAKLYRRACTEVATICQQVGSLPMGVSALCVTRAGRDRAVKCGLDMVTVTKEVVATEIPPEVRFSDLGPSSRLLRTLGPSCPTRRKVNPDIARVDVPTGFAYNVFLSHSAKDAAMAGRVLKDLNSRKPDCLHVYYAPKSNETGKQWKQQLREALANCSELIVLLSRDSLASNWVILEIGAAWARDIRVTPIVIEKDINVNELPDFIRDFQLFSYYSDAYELFLAELKKRTKGL